MRKDKLDEFVETERKGLADVAEDPRVTINAIMNALVQEKPPTRLLTGSNAPVFHILSWLPDKTRDFVLYGRMIKELHVQYNQ